ncbi:MAG TPA: GNAT family N-acetyltransferase [Anaerolineaceae bacterium]|nr:GNAT family N-acetyltransferase [Anaerolineaceae bacterium]
MFTILAIGSGQYLQPIRDIFWEYLLWVNENVSREYGISFDIAAILDQDMRDLGKFMPPSGRLLLGMAADVPAGIGCLTRLTAQCAEIRRMYVRPEHRRIGLGRAILEGLLDEARQLGYPQVRLDIARFMTDAHRLYRGLGFEEIQPYEGSEIPLDFQPHWVFMERSLAAGS